MWTYEVHELSEGFSAIVYDPDGICPNPEFDHLSEAEAARIVANMNREPGYVSRG